MQHKASFPHSGHARHAVPRAPGITPRDRNLLLLAGTLLTLTFVTGGSSQLSGWGVMTAELLALVVLLLVLMTHAWRDRAANARWGLAVAAMIVAIPLLQLLPIPAWLWQWPAPRLALQHDLAAAGVTHIDYRWSLAPAATERGLFELLPGAALFVAALALPYAAWRHLLWWLIGLIVFSAILAFAQMQLPQDSIVNPFPQYVPAWAGVFGNRNHQACALAMALILALALALAARTRIHRGEPGRSQVIPGAIVIALTAATLPLVGSRAGVIIAVAGAAITVIAYGTGPWRRPRRGRVVRWRSVVPIAILALSLYGAIAWVRQDVDASGLRWRMATETARLATASMPLGGGAGSFVRMFEQFTRGALMQEGYINAAHNDYLQWWFAGGALAIVAIIAAAALLITSALRVLQLPRESRLRGVGLAALIAALAPLLHSTVDYPLRTPALMAVFAMLCGIAVGAGARARIRMAQSIANTGAPATASGLHGVLKSRPPPDASA